MSDIRVPDLGESIVEATILNWLRKEGDVVSQGDAVAELETDKVNVEVIANEGGVLSSIKRQAGETVQVGEVIATVSESGAAPAAQAAPAPSAQPAPAATQAPAQSSAPQPVVAAAPVTGDDGSSRATPAVRRLARELGIDLSQLQPAGGLGRITEADVIAYKNQSAAPVSAAPAAASASVAAPSERADEKRERMSRRRLTIAKRLVEAQHTAAMLTTFNEIDMTNVMEVRKRRKDRFKEEQGVNLGFMSFFTKAVVGALKAFPRLNAEIQGDDMVLKYHYDIGVAVAAEGGLVVPVVRGADRLTFGGIEREIARLAGKARDNTLGVDDLQGGTFTITNGGVFGSLFSTPILNSPQVGILGMHGIQQRPIAVNGQIEIRPMMYIALSYDHRIVDGSEAVRFLVKVKQFIEDPESLLIEG